MISTSPKLQTQVPFLCIQCLSSFWWIQTMLNSCGHLDVLKHSCGSLYWTSSPPRKALKSKDEDSSRYEPVSPVPRRVPQTVEPGGEVLAVSVRVVPLHEEVGEVVGGAQQGGDIHCLYNIHYCTTQSVTIFSPTLQSKPSMSVLMM